ncbi:MAG: hypothetical protein ACK4PR_08025, partial [Gammaproteobacteria bacterium]
MADYRQRGLDQAHEQDQLMLIRDTRTLLQRMKDFFTDPFNTMIIMVVMAFSLFLIPAFADLITLVGIILFLFYYSRKLSLPF